MRKSFVFYGTFKDMLDNIEDKELRLLVYEAIVEYGLTGSYDESNSLVKAFMQQTAFQIDRAQENYEKTIASGKKGGAKKKYDHDEIRRLFKDGKNKDEIAAMIGCSTKTVERATAGLRSDLETAET